MLKFNSRIISIGIRRYASKFAIKDGPGLEHFISKSRHLNKIFPTTAESDTYISPSDYYGNNRTVAFITYGCQMNVNDMEIVKSILFNNGYTETTNEKTADIVLLMTCSIRESAEEKIWKKLSWLKYNNKKSTVGVLGCMAERIRDEIITRSKAVDLVVGPDSYRDLPRLLAVTRSGKNAMNVQLSLEETYADIQPVRMDADTKTAFVSIMRGCDNMCTYCVVPFTRGRERSRPLESIVDEVKALSLQGFKQVTLLGQNVNSYRDTSQISTNTNYSTVPGFKTVYKPKTGGRTFVNLLEKVSEIDPEMRIRFTSPHPKDFPIPVIELIKERKNICNQLHLPAQSGDDLILEKMGRGYTRELYTGLVQQIREIIPNVSLTSDFIAGFCNETEAAHQKTIDLIKEVGYSFCYVFPYSMRERTRAHHRLNDNVPVDVKQRRSNELALAMRETALKHNEALIGTKQLVLIEGLSRRSSSVVAGRVDCGVKVNIENEEISNSIDDTKQQIAVGDYVVAEIISATSQSLKGKALYRATLQNYS